MSTEELNRQADHNPRTRKSLDRIVFVSFLLVFAGVLAIGGASLYLVHTMLDKTYAIEEESHNVDFVNHLHNKFYSLMLVIHDLMVHPDENRSRLATEISGEIDRDIAKYLKHEEASAYPESKEEVRLLLDVQKKLQDLQDSVDAIAQLPGRGLVASEPLAHWNAVLDRQADDIALLMREINRLHFDIITRKVEKSRHYKTLILGLYLFFSVLGLALVYLGYRLNSRFVVQPIKRLARFTGKVSEGELGDRVSIDSRTEIGELYNATNAMLDRIQAHEEFLVEFNQHMERKVDERTRDLQDVCDSLRATQSQLLRAEKMAMLGQIAASVNHEIRTPLNALYMNVQLVRKALDTCAGECSERRDIADRIAIIDREVHRISDMLEEFVRYARLAPPELAKVDLNRVAKYVAEMLDERAEQSGVRLTLSLAEPLPGVRADENKLIQALVNLCVNAIDAMPQGGTLTLATKDVGDQVEVSVADTGTGIPEEEIDKVFLPFYTKKETGLGFGLSIVQRIVEDHAGKIACRSRVGEGTVFGIQLPVEKPIKSGDINDLITANR